MLYRFQIELSDIDRGVYQSLDFRVSQHPSESPAYLLTRVLAYALNVREGLEFSPAGLHDPEAPALKAAGLHGATDLWIEIGNPSAKKLHKASKSAKQVVVYTYKNPDLLLKEIEDNKVHRGAEIRIYAFAAKFLESLEGRLEKNNRWSLLQQQGHLDIDAGGENLATDVRSFGLDPA